jgi:hypothetical protein
MGLSGAFFEASGTEHGVAGAARRIGEDGNFLQAQARRDGAIIAHAGENAGNRRFLIVAVGAGEIEWLFADKAGTPFGGRDECEVDHKSNCARAGHFDVMPERTLVGQVLDKFGGFAGIGEVEGEGFDLAAEVNVTAIRQGRISIC